jgi:hypothetical protein
MSFDENIPRKLNDNKTTYCSVVHLKIYSVAVVGVEAFEADEVHAGRGNSDKVVVVGLPDTAVKEYKDRVTSVIAKADCAGRAERGSPSILRWPMSGRKVPALMPIALGMLKLEENNFDDALAFAPG